KEEEQRRDPFTQKWKPIQRKEGLSRELKALMKIAHKYGLQLNAIAPSRRTLRSTPMWEHPHADTHKLRVLSAQVALATKCIIHNHKLVTVGDFEQLAAMERAPNHNPRRATCACEMCEALRNATGCANPAGCITRASAFLDTLPPKWDPRGELPEDYEDQMMENTPNPDNSILFDRRVTSQGLAREQLRIFTDNALPSRTKVEVK
ncbi:uncharacterized protein BXZ73DRAFT_1215, partial [Epithele typhae]|uniref:uncharacterized protein n=1 Tax=Epithele typhae TaxID=378194 RepID=UPI002008BF54